MRHAAYDYLPLGFRLVPCAYATKRPLIKDWTTRASNDRDQIRAWLKEWPRANWAIRCGRQTPDLAIAVIDCETDGALKEIEERFGRILAPKCRSGRGWHIYVQVPVTLALRSVTAQKLYERFGIANVELRGDNALCLLPPSKHDEIDCHYAWLPGYEPWALAIPEAPAWVVEAMREPPPPERKPYAPRAADDGKAALHWAANDMAGRTCDRNNTLCRHVKWLCNDLGYSVDEIMPELLPAYVASGKDERGGRATIQSAAGRGE